MKKLYRLYGKDSGMKKMRPVNWLKGDFTNNLIFATIFNEEEGMRALSDATSSNEEMHFELREVKEE
jgi:hypothetical protein